MIDIMHIFCMCIYGWLHKEHIWFDHNAYAIVIISWNIYTHNGCEYVIIWSKILKKFGENVHNQIHEILEPFVQAQCHYVTFILVVTYKLHFSQYIFYVKMHNLKTKNFIIELNIWLHNLYIKIRICDMQWFVACIFKTTF